MSLPSEEKRGWLYRYKININLDYGSMFKQSIEKIKEEGRYREFKSLLRDCGNFPKAF